MTSRGRPSQRVAYGLVFVAACLWGLLGVLASGVLASGVSPLEVAFWRSALAAALFVPHALALGVLRLASRRDLPAFVAFAFIGVTVFYSSFVLAVEAGGVSLATILLYSAPAFVALFAWLLLREPMTTLKVALVALALAGVTLVSLDSGSGVRVTTASLFWGLVAGASYASYYIFGKWVLSRYEPVAIFAIVLPIGALGLVPFVEFAPKSPAVWGSLGAMALLSTYGAYALYYRGLREVEASRAVLVATIEPVVAVLLAALLLGERLGGWGVVGGVLVVSASLLTVVTSRSGRATRGAAAEAGTGR